MCPKITANMSEIPPQMAEGEHVCRIVGSEHKIGRDKGTAYISWKLLNMTDGWTLYYSTPIEGRGAGMFKHFVHAAGENNYMGGEFDTDILTGRLVRCKLIIQDGFYKVKDVLEVDVPIVPNPDEIF